MSINCVKSIHPIYKNEKELTDFVNLNTEVFRDLGLVLIPNDDDYGIDFSVLWKYKNNIFLEIAKVEHERSEIWKSKEWPRRKDGFFYDYSVPFRKSRYFLKQEYIDRCIKSTLESKWEGGRRWDSSMSKLEIDKWCKKSWPKNYSKMHIEYINVNKNLKIIKPIYYCAINSTGDNCWFDSMYNIFRPGNDWKLVYQDTGRKVFKEDIFIRKERTIETAKKMEGFDSFKNKVKEDVKRIQSDIIQSIRSYN